VSNDSSSATGVSRSNAAQLQSGRCGCYRTCAFCLGEKQTAADGRWSAAGKDFSNPRNAKTSGDALAEMTNAAPQAVEMKLRG